MLDVSKNADVDAPAGKGNVREGHAQLVAQAEAVGERADGLKRSNAFVEDVLGVDTGAYGPDKFPDTADCTGGGGDLFEARHD